MGCGIASPLHRGVTGGTATARGAEETRTGDEDGASPAPDGLLGLWVGGRCD